MAETYRKTKIEKLYKELTIELEFLKSRTSQDSGISNWLEGQVHMLENVLQKIENEFDLTAE